MAYFRGDPYIWLDGEDNLHIWRKVRDTSCEDEEQDWPSSVVISSKVFDQLAVMRLAQLLREGRLDEVIAAAVQEQGDNEGCRALVETREADSRIKQTVAEIDHGQK